jgi:hypothetical protein
MDRDEMSNIYRKSSIDASYEVSVHLAKGFQRRRLKCEKLVHELTPSDVKVIAAIGDSITVSSLSYLTLR